MPEYRVLIDNRTYKIELLKKEAEDFLDVTIDNKHLQVKLEKDNRGAASPFKIEIGEKTYEVEADRVGRSFDYNIKVNGMPFRTQLAESVKRGVVKAPAPRAAV
ncbi:MAG: hypothetical protein JSV64_01875, partial [Candidatus Bathyarchaeota archaeon]